MATNKLSDFSAALKAKLPTFKRTTSNKPAKTQAQKNAEHIRKMQALSKLALYGGAAAALGGLAAGATGAALHENPDIKGLSVDVTGSSDDKITVSADVDRETVSHEAATNSMIAGFSTAVGGTALAGLGAYGVGKYSAQAAQIPSGKIGTAAPAA